MEPKFAYFSEEDVLHLVISEEEEAHSVEVSPNNTAEFNDRGELIGIEILPETVKSGSLGNNYQRSSEEKMQELEDTVDGIAHLELENWTEFWNSPFRASLNEFLDAVLDRHEFPAEFASRVGMRRRLLEDLARADSVITPADEEKLRSLSDELFHANSVWPGREGDWFQRLKDAVASKFSEKPLSAFRLNELACELSRFMVGIRR
jgi:hypothetical protein